MRYTASVPGLSVTVITRDEAANIVPALESVSWADDIVVVDSGSTDGTTTLVRQFTDRVYVREWPGYVDQKNHAASLARFDWILSLDADERVTPALRDEILRVLAADPPYFGYRVPRVSHYLGRWIRSTDWYPDHQLRLYDRRRARWQGRYVHESVSADGDVGRLHADLQHHPYRNVSHHLATIDRYSDLWARQAMEDGRRAGPVDLVLHPPAAFLRNYVARRGFRDGVPGFIVSMLNSYSVLAKFIKLWEAQRQAHP